MADDSLAAVPLKRFLYKDHYPGNAIEEQYPDEEFTSLPPPLLAWMRAPLDPSIGTAGRFYNGNVTTFFPVQVGTGSSVQALIENKRRSYLLIQNLGPGNIWVQFGQVAAVGLCLTLVVKQVYEPNPTGLWDGGTGVIAPARGSLWVIADLANTTCIVGEGTWTPT